MVTDTIANAAKLATLAALDQTPGAFVGRVELNKRIDDMQGAETGWNFSKTSPTVPFTYCTSTLQATGLVEMGSKENNRGAVRAARITPLGSQLWPAIAGAYLPWERDNPDLSLGRVIGSSQSAFQRGSSTRIDIFRHLLASPEGQASVTELKDAAGASYGSTSHTLTELCNQGLLTAETKYGPEQRRFALDVSSKMAAQYYGRMSPDVQKAVNAIETLKQEGVHETDGGQIIRKIKDLYPGVDPREAWRQMLDWMKNHRKEPTTLREIDTMEGEKVRNRLRIAAAYAGPITRFLELRSRLATDAGFRADTAQEGAVYFRSKQRTAQHLRRVRLESQAFNARPESGWESIFYENVPTEGIVFDALHGNIIKQTGPISEKAFMKRLAKHDDLLQVTTATAQEGVTRVPRIALKRHRFASNWTEAARCRAPGVDLALFGEQPTTAAGKANTNKAIAHCKACPVRRACLKTAIDDKERHGVWGGMPGRDIQKLNATQVAAVRETVHIEA